MQDSNPNIDSQISPPVGPRLRSVRKLKSLTITDVAKQAGLAFTTVQSVEVRSDPHLSTLVKVCAALDVRLIDILDDDSFAVAVAKVAMEDTVK